MANKKFQVPINLVNLSSDPGTATEGDIYYNTTSDVVRVYANGSWASVGSGGGSASDSFKTISVTGQDSVVADSSTDTLNLIAGTNVSITTDATADSITINSTGNYTSVDSITYPDYIIFDTTPETEPTAAGSLWWNPDDETLNVQLDSAVTLQVGQEHVVRVKNDSGSVAIPEMRVVMFAGATGDTVEVTPALSTASYEPELLLGVTTEQIPADGFGFVTQFGFINKVDTSTPGWSLGDLLYVDPVNAGLLTNVKPSAPNWNFPVAAVTRVHASTGRILVRALPGKHLHDLVDVAIDSPADNEVLAYNSGSGVWINQTPSEAGLAALSGAVFTGDIELDVTNKLIFDGTTDEAYKTTLYIVDPTNDREILLPDADGTLALTGDITTIVDEYIPLLQKGAAQGVAELDIDTLVPVEQIPDLSATYLTPEAADLDYQPLDSDLTDIAALTENGILKKTSGTWGMDTSTYLTSFTEEDPVFVAHPAYGIDSDDIEDWNLAYGWGDHALANYAASSHNHSLDSLSNVVVTGTPSDGQAIVWDTTTSKWVNETVTQDLSSYAPLASPTFTGTVNSTNLNVSGDLKPKFIRPRYTGDGTESSDYIATNGTFANSTLTLYSGMGGAQILTKKDIVFSSEDGGQYLGSVSSNNQIATIGNLSSYLPLAGGTLTGSLTLPSDPTTALQAATKQYVDEVAQGLSIKPSVHAATTENLSADYDNGIDGVGATLTATTDGEWVGTDGVLTGWDVLNSILVKDQTNAEENGRYYISDYGSLTTPWVLTRCIYCDTSEEIPGSYIFVTDGDTYAGTGWVAVIDSPATFVIGTDDINYTQFSGTGTIIAGTNIEVDGNEISVVDAPTFSGSVSINNLSLTNSLGYQYGGTGLSSLGSAGYVLAVNSTVDGLEWVEMTGGGGGSSFTNSSELAALLSDETGTGKAVFNTNPTLIGDVRIGDSSVSTDAQSLQLGVGRTGSGYAFIDLVGDTTYTDYGLRLIRNNNGANANSILAHRGTGILQINVQDAGVMEMAVNGSVIQRINSGGDITFKSAVNTDVTTGTTSATSTFNTTVYSSAEFIVYASTSTGNYVSKVMMLARGSATPVITEYAILTQGTAPTVTITPSYSAPNAVLTVAVTSGTNIEIVKTAVSI
jgi:hypothetical protein